MQELRLTAESSDTINSNKIAKVATKTLVSRLQVRMSSDENKKVPAKLILEATLSQRLLEIWSTARIDDPAA